MASPKCRQKRFWHFCYPRAHASPPNELRDRMNRIHRTKSFGMSFSGRAIMLRGMLKDRPTPRPNRPSWGYWIVASVIVIGVSMFADQWVDGWLVVPPHSQAHEVAHFLTRAGEWWVAGPVGLAVGLALFWTGRSELGRKIVAATLTGLATGVAGTLIRTLTGRTPPQQRSMCRKGSTASGTIRIGSAGSIPSCRSRPAMSRRWPVWRRPSG